jgi:DNA/RNA-binding domain of Phe-tRNA-synthetase-like protein
MRFSVTEAWRETYPGAWMGVLALRGVANPKRHGGLDHIKAGLEAELRSRWADKQELRAAGPLPVYKGYYRRFKKTYHVQMQLESVALKGKPVPRVAALVEAMFVAELKNLLLTAGHDLDEVEQPVRLDVATGHEAYVRLNGQDQVLKAGDMYVADSAGVLSSVIYGPAQRASIASGTTGALFTVYAPPGIEEERVRAHLADIEAYARLIAPGAETELLQVFGTS